MDNFSHLLKDYEKANNSHDWSKVEPFIHNDASYFFTDGTFIGLEEIKKAVVATFDKILEEKYVVSNIKWIYSDNEIAICTYNFHWHGIVDGVSKAGSGRGTNIWKNTDDKWQIIHEHLSK